MRGSTRLRRSLRRCLGRGNGALSGRASWARARGLPDPCSPMAQRQKDSLALPSAEHQAVESGQAGVETWKYKAKNSLMYYPEGERRAGPAGWTGLQGVFLSGPSGVQILRAAGGGGVGGVGSVGGVSTGVRAQAVLGGDQLISLGPAPLTPWALLPPPGVPDEEQLFKKPRQVVHKNTRFLRDPFSQALSRSQLQQAAALNAQVRAGPAALCSGVLGLGRAWQHSQGWLCSPSRGLRSGPVLVRQVGQVCASLWGRGKREGRQRAAGLAGWARLRVADYRADPGSRAGQ